MDGTEALSISDFLPSDLLQAFSICLSGPRTSTHHCCHLPPQLIIFQLSDLQIHGKNVFEKRNGLLTIILLVKSRCIRERVSLIKGLRSLKWYLDSECAQIGKRLHIRGICMLKSRKYSSLSCKVVHLIVWFVPCCQSILPLGL